MRVLVACEHTGIVRDEFARAGAEAWSCDLLPSQRPGRHIQRDILEVLGGGYGKFDLMICHPPCQHLAVSGAKHFAAKIADGRQPAAVAFFLKLANAPIPRICIENPVGIMNTLYRPPDQIINPWMFGDPYQKTTCLWLKNLPSLFHWEGDSLFDFKNTHTHRGEFVTVVNKKTGKKSTLPKWYSDAGKANRGNKRSATFPGIAAAMATQWGKL